MDVPRRPGGPPHFCYHRDLRIGIHTSIAGSLEKAALKAAGLGANTFQIFSASPRMWRAGRPDPDQVRRIRQTRERLDLSPLVIHDNYLINLASADPAIRAQSIAAFRGEVERALLIGAEYLVAHPGSYGDQGLEKGIQTLIESLREAVDGMRTAPLMLLFENTAGGGTKLGGCFEEMKVMREVAAQFAGINVGYCLDTAHLLASGYDIANEGGLRATVRDIEAVLGLEHVRIFHANDSKTPLGSHVDRHAHIGEGYIGAEGFRRILNHPKLRTKPFILETPVDKEGDDRRNVERLKSLCRRKPTTTTRSN